MPVARQLQENPKQLREIWVYEDDFVKGLIRVREQKVVRLYVDSFFAGQGVGGKLLDFAVERFHVNHLWVLEKNQRAIVFYGRHGFQYSGVWKYEEGTTERLLWMSR